MNHIKKILAKCWFYFFILGIIPKKKDLQIKFQSLLFYHYFLADWIDIFLNIMNNDGLRCFFNSIYISK